MKSLETMARYKKELTECARNLKLPFLAEHLDEILHEAQEKQQTYSEFLSTSNPQLSSSASFLRLNVLSSLN